jgi:hypothetical protein
VKVNSSYSRRRRSSNSRNTPPVAALAKHSRPPAPTSAGSGPWAPSGLSAVGARLTSHSAVRPIPTTNRTTVVAHAAIVRSSDIEPIAVAFILTKTGARPRP